MDNSRILYVSNRSSDTESKFTGDNDNNNNSFTSGIEESREEGVVGIGLEEIRLNETGVLPS